MKPNPKRSVLAGYLWDNRENRRMLVWAAGLQIIAWLVYKWCLPGTDYFYDSFSYVYAAINDCSIFYRPMGYARFLSFLHGFSISAGLVVSCQYFLISWSALILFFSIDYLLTFSNRWLKWLAWAFVTLQPLHLVLANLLAGDGLFTALTILWVALLIRVLLRPSWWALILQALVLFLAFQVRYNALYYPLISCLVFLMAKGASYRYRAAGILFTLLLIGNGYHSIRTRTEQLTGADVFSGFSGWQMANNALYLSPFIRLEEENFDDPDLRALHQYVRHFVDSITPGSREEVRQGKIGSAFLWDSRSPLKLYLSDYCRVNRQSYLQSWYQVATLYGDYGKTLILDHPVTFCRHFLWPNACSFVLPDAECLAGFRNAAIPVPRESAEWFGWDAENAEPEARCPGLHKWLIACYRLLHAVLVFCGLFLPLGWLVVSKRYGSYREGSGLLIFWYSLFLLNIVFSVVASQVVLRYECAWFVLGAGILLWFLDRMIMALKPGKEG